MSALLSYSSTDLAELQEWFAAESRNLFHAKAQCEDEEDRVRLHMAAQDAHQIAAEIRRFAIAHRALREDGLIDG